MSTTTEEYRLECLRIAASSATLNTDPDTIIQIADKLQEFIFKQKTVQPSLPPPDGPVG